MKLSAFFLTLLIAILGALLLVGKATADSMTMTTPSGVTIVLRDSPCHTSVADQIKDEWRDKFKGGLAYFNGQSMQLRWMIDSENDAILIGEDGSAVAIPLTNFMRTSAVRTPIGAI